MAEGLIPAHARSRAKFIVVWFGRARTRILTSQRLFVNGWNKQFEIDTTFNFEFYSHFFNQHFINTSSLLTFCFFGRRRRHFLLIAQPIMNILITKVTKVWIALVSNKLTGSDEHTPFIPACTRHCLRHLKLRQSFKSNLHALIGWFGAASVSVAKRQKRMKISKETIKNLLWGRRTYDFLFHTIVQVKAIHKSLHTFLLALIVISYVPKAVNEFKYKCIAVTPLWVSGNAELSSYSVYQGIIFCLKLSLLFSPFLRAW